MRRLPSALAGRYLDAKEYLLSAGYAGEIDWQDDLDFDLLTETAFLRESAWVVLSAGIAERVVRSVFPRITEAFCNWVGASEIVENADISRANALQIFRHEGKVSSILEIAHRVHTLGFQEFRSRISREELVFLRTLPFIGDVTALHLAKNLGINVEKPDRHLCRVSSHLGFSCPMEMCTLLAEELAEKRSVVDLVIWRFATVRRDYLEFFGSALDLDPNQEPNGAFDS